MGKRRGDMGCAGGDGTLRRESVEREQDGVEVWHDADSQEMIIRKDVSVRVDRGDAEGAGGKDDRPQFSWK